MWLCVASVGLFTYAFSSGFVYVGEKDYERSVASTRVNTSDMEAALANAPAGAGPANETTQQVLLDLNAPGKHQGLFSGAVVPGLRPQYERSKTRLLY
jgi:hypothetical protein